MAEAFGDQERFDEELALNAGVAPVNNASANQTLAEKSKHPTAVVFHLAFKIAAVVVYLLLSNLFNNFIIVFVTCVVLLACDFWTVKNVTGRLLVGLRWWNEVKEDGTNQWIFESASESRKIHPFDSMVFWTSLYVTPVVWSILGFASIFSFQWLLVILVALILNGANLIGYWKCQKDAKSKIQSFIASRL